MYEGAIQDLIDALGRLPGIGPKSAQRIAFHILQSEPEVAVALVDALRAIVHKLFAVAKVHVGGEILIAGLLELKITGSLATPELPTKLK